MGRDGFDLAVVGAGLGGLAAAALARAEGLDVALLEAHDHLGGCAGYFDRGPYTFDAGATALMGLGPDEPVGALLGRIGLAFEAQTTPAYRVVLRDRTVELVPERGRFLDAMESAFPGHPRRLRAFWDLQERVGRTLLRVAGAAPRMPARSLGDLARDLEALGLSGLLAATTVALTVRDVLRILGLWDDRPFRALIAMLLQDTAQAGPETVPFANASACLQAYRDGMSRPRGSMRALMEGIGDRFRDLGGDLRRRTIVDRVEPAGGGFVLSTRRRARIAARQVAFNLPLDLAARLLGRPLEGTLGRKERQSRAAWGAFTGYLAIDRAAVPDEAPLFHQVLRDLDALPHEGNNVLVSLSPPDDPGYGPPGVRVATLSTHTRADGWHGLDRPSYEARKADYQARLLDALGRALPDAPASLVHAEFATPRSFARYTRRTLGLVGGPPVSRRNSNVFAVGADALGPGLWLVGDSVFPGQGTFAVVLSAVGVVERLTGRRWRTIRAGNPAPQALCSTGP